MPRYGPGPVYVRPRRQRLHRLLVLVLLLEPRRNKPPKPIKVQKPKIRKPRKQKGGGKK